MIDCLLPFRLRQMLGYPFMSRRCADALFQSGRARG